MYQQQNHPDHKERNHQIKKLLQAIQNYCPTSEQLSSMENAKKQMQRNIEKKYHHSQTNANYKFPFIKEVQSDDDQFHDFMTDSKFYTLNDQNKPQNKARVSVGNQKSRPPLYQKSSNKLPKNMNEQKNYHQRLSLKNTQTNQSLVATFQKVIKSNLKCQTPKIVKKQIILTHKRQTGEKQNHNVIETKDYIHSSVIKQNVCELGESNGIRAKLKIKKPNSTLNETKKQIHLRTQNNVTFKPYNDNFLTQNIHENNRQQISKPIHQQPSLEDSLFNNSRLNQNIEENANFQYPQKQMFNVHELKEKLKDTSKSSKKIGIKRHKRTATEGDTSMIKIKLFSNSFRKEDYHEIDSAKKHNVSTNLFMKKTQNVSIHNVIERTVRSTTSQHSLKKGISVCGKSRHQNDKSQQKSTQKVIQKSLSKQRKIEKKGEDKFQPKFYEKSQEKNFTIMLKPSESKKKQFMESKSVRKDLSAQKGISLYQKRQNYETARISKINSIMSNLKEEYKNKNSSKSRTGIRTTVCT